MIFQTKCIFHEISFETSIKGSFRSYLKDNDNSQVHLTIRVEDPLGEEIFAKVGVAQADFHLPDVYEGEYKVCFTANGTRFCDNEYWFSGDDTHICLYLVKLPNFFCVHVGVARVFPQFFFCSDYHTAQSTRITLKWEEGVDATDWEMVAKRDNLDTVHTELLRLEDSVHDIHLELQHIRRKEEQMRDINGENAKHSDSK